VKTKSLFARAVRVLIHATLIAIVAPFPAWGADLHTEIDAALDAAPFEHAIWGVMIEDEDGSTLYERNADSLMVPASVRKLFSMAWVSSCHGYDATIPTEFEIRGPVVDGSLRGDLVIRGHGDPSFAGRYTEERDRVLAPVVAALRSRGIVEIRGSVVADVSRFDRDTIPGGWKVNNIGGYWAAPVDALAYNENVSAIVLGGDCSDPTVTTDPFIRTTVALRCDEPGTILASERDNTIRIESRPTGEGLESGDLELIAVADPALWTATNVGESLQRRGFRIDGAPRVESVDSAPGEALVTLHSPPLVTLVGSTLEDSINLFAEELYKGQAGTAAGMATYESARELERQFLVDDVGLDPRAFSFEDGSGLSVVDYITPRGAMALLRYLSAPGRRAFYQQLMPEPGRGTLRRRLRDLAGRVHAKTGTLGGVDALAGWVERDDGTIRRFVFFANHHVERSSEARAVIDSIVRRIAK